MAQSPEAMAQSMIANLPEKTGKSLGQWLVVVADSGLEKHGQIVAHLKTEHGMTHGFANLVAHESKKAGAPAQTGDDLVAAQYDGAKAGLRPIYDAILGHLQGFGDGLEIAPKKSYVSLRRSKQFALVQPSTRTRVDLGLKFADRPTTDRLEASKSWNSMVTHRVRITDLAQVDDELVGWLKDAFDEA